MRMGYRDEVGAGSMPVGMEKEEEEEEGSLNCISITTCVKSFILKMNSTDIET